MFAKYRDRIRDEIQTGAFWRDVISEYVATFFLVSVQAALPMSWDVGLGGVVQVSLGMGFIVTTIAWTLGDFGGAHMNPAVTICMALLTKITVVRAVLYILVQCGGSLTGAAFIYILTPAGKRGRLAVTSLGPGVTPLQGVFLEAWITSIMVVTILGSTNSRRKGNVFIATVPIGMAVTLGIMACFMSTGASMNPARSLGPAIMMGLWENHWVYWAGPILGSTIAGVVYSMFDRVDIKKYDAKHKKDDDHAKNNNHSNNNCEKDVYHVSAKVDQNTTSTSFHRMDSLATVTRQESGASVHSYL